MRLAPFVECARSNGASDLHLEPGLPPAFRIRGQLYPNGEPITGAAILAIAKELLDGGSRPISLTYYPRPSFSAAPAVPLL
jgi:Tfp pilus assembly pilus retraction ATPase PilT